MRRWFLFLLFGLLFGFVLSRAAATDYDAIAGMFLLEDLHLMGVIGVAIALAGVGLALVRRRAARSGDPTALTVAPKPRKAGNLVGGLIFGAGWAVTGTCPGTGLSQVGEGKLLAIFTVAGIFLGTALYRRVGARVEAWLTARTPNAARGDDAEAAIEPRALRSGV